MSSGSTSGSGGTSSSGNAASSGGSGGVSGSGNSGSGGSGGGDDSGSGDDASSTGSSGSTSGSGSGASPGDSGTASDSGSSGGVDGSASSSGGDAGIDCPTAPCSAGLTCCTQANVGTPACQGSCAANNALKCLSPADCGGATPDCCGTLVVNGGLLPNCNTLSYSTQCVASCTSNLVATCLATDTLHLCAVRSDCAKDPANPNCCALSGRQVCVSDSVKMVAGLTCK